MSKTIQPTKRDFPLLVLVQIISILGTALLRFALSSIPLLLAPLGGALADRFSRRNMMSITYRLVLCSPCYPSSW